MWKFIKQIFNPGGTVDKTLDMIDKGKYTEQEKAEFTKSYFKEKLNLSATTRRYLAWSVVGIYLILMLPTGCISFFNVEYAKEILEVINGSRLGEAFWTIIGLYFGLGALNINKNKK